MRLLTQFEGCMQVQYYIIFDAIGTMRLVSYSALKTEMSF